MKDRVSSTRFISVVVLGSLLALAGAPAISLPSGLSSEGLPMAIQLAAGPFEEARLLTAAHWCERALEVHLRPPLNE